MSAHPPPVDCLLGARAVGCGSWRGWNSAIPFCVQAVTHVASTAVSISGTAGVSLVLAGDALRRRRCAGMFFAKGRASRGKSANFSWNARAMREPGGLERRPTSRARRRTHEDHTTLPRRRATPQTALPRRWPAGWAICPIRSKMHDVHAERARRRLPAPASPWRPPGLHVAATEGTLRLGELPPPSSIQVARATRWTKLRGHCRLPNLTPVVAW